MRATDLDDVCASIGFTATNILQCWFNGRHIRVPMRAEGHWLALVIGEPALRALVRDWPGETIVVPTLNMQKRYARERELAELLARGVPVIEISRALGVPLRTVFHLRRIVLARGWVDFARDHRMCVRRRGKKGVFRNKNLGTNEVFQQPPGGSGDKTP